MKFITSYKAVFFALFFLIIAGATACKQDVDDAASKKSEASTTIEWLSLAELEQKQKKEPKKVIVDLYTDWCGWCKKMDKATFEHPEIARYVNENFYALKFNAETKEEINFKGKTYNFVPAGRRGYNELTKVFAYDEQGRGRLAYPNIAFLDEDLNRIDAFPGYKGPQDFDGLAHFIAGNHYKNSNFNQFKTGFNSKISVATTPKQPGIQVTKKKSATSSLNTTKTPQNTSLKRSAAGNKAIQTELKVKPRQKINTKEEFHLAKQSKNTLKQEIRRKDSAAKQSRN